MIIKLHPSVGEAQALALANTHKAFLIQDNGLTLITGSSLKEIPADLQAVAEKHWVFPSHDRHVRIGENDYLFS